MYLITHHSSGVRDIGDASINLIVTYEGELVSFILQILEYRIKRN